MTLSEICSVQEQGEVQILTGQEEYSQTKSACESRFPPEKNDDWPLANASRAEKPPKWRARGSSMPGRTFECLEGIGPKSTDIGLPTSVMTPRKARGKPLTHFQTCVALGIFVTETIGSLEINIRLLDPFTGR